MRKTKVDETYFRAVCEDAANMSEACRTLGLHPSTFRRIAKRLGCYRPNQFNRPGYKPHGNTRQDVIDKYLSNKQCITTAALRRQLIRHEIKDAKCEVCGLSEWMGMPIPLELHHKDHNRYNNSLDNLQILCPTCHSQISNGCNTRIAQAIVEAPQGYIYKNEKVDKSGSFILNSGIIRHVYSLNDNYSVIIDDSKVVKIQSRKERSGINRSFKRSFKRSSKRCSVCGREFTGPNARIYKRKYCSYECAHKAAMQYEVTPEELLDMLKSEPNYTKVALKLGVTDNAVKKRCKKLGIYEEVNKLIQNEKVARGARVRCAQLSRSKE